MTNVAMLQTAADLSASITAQGVSSLVPAGVIMAFGGATAPTGWLLCEGAAISRTTYATLFAAIGVAHGYGDNSTTFNLPDYRGRFIRGRANSSGNDPDRAARTAAATGGNTGDNVGSIQTDTTRAPRTTGFTGNKTDLNHGHAFGTTPQRPVGAAQVAAGSNYNIPSAWSDGTISNSSMTGTFAISGGDNESRPLNAYVNYIIKI